MGSFAKAEYVLASKHRLRLLLYLVRNETLRYGGVRDAYRKVYGEVSGDVPGAFTRVLRELERSGLVERSEENGYTELRLTPEGRALMAPFYALWRAPTGLALVSAYLVAKPWLASALQRPVILAADAVAVLYLLGLAALLVMIVRKLLVEGLALEEAPSGLEAWALTLMPMMYVLLHLARRRVRERRAS